MCIRDSLNSERSYVANTLAIVGDGDDSTGRKSSDFKQYEKAIAVTDVYKRQGLLLTLHLIMENQRDRQAAFEIKFDF